MKELLICISCKKSYSVNQIRYRCDCGELLDYQKETGKTKVTKELFSKRLSDLNLPYRSGVWRYKEMLIDTSPSDIVTKPEGNTNLYSCGMNQENGFSEIGHYVGIETLYAKHEGENPTGSFKDRGMTVGVTVAKKLKVKAVACASTGNTSASLASYAQIANIPCFVFIPKGKVALGKLSQTLAFGAHTLEIDGDFDIAMNLVYRVCNMFGIYLLNSVNPFRVEGQKTTIFELYQQLNWIDVDWIVLPGGNLGNTSSVGKALSQLKSLGFIKKTPRVAVIQAEGANPFYESYRIGFRKKVVIKANTTASAINIGNPISFEKGKQVIRETNGVVEEVTDEEIGNAKAVIDGAGIGCEPASAATIAGIKKLAAKKIIKPKDIVVAILTGSMLKDAESTLDYHTRNKGRFANFIITVEPDIRSIEKVLKNHL